jgi:hypothetical protein
MQKNLGQKNGSHDRETLILVFIFLPQIFLPVLLPHP